MSTTPSIQLPPGRRLSILFSFGIAFLIFTSLAGSLGFWALSPVKLLPAARYSVAIALVIIAAAFMIARAKRLPLTLDVEGFALGLAALFLSDWLCREYNLLQGPSIRGEILLGSILVSALLFHHRVRWITFLAPLTIIALLYAFFFTSHGAPIFSDDHPTFLFRLQLLKENFPRIPFYSPLWNGGFDARDFFATGALAPFFLSAPIVYLTDLATSYNFIVAFLLFGIVPGTAYLAARLERLPAPGPAIAAVLALSNGLLWYRWVLKYGTMGFAMAAALTPLNLILFSRLLRSDQAPRPRDAVLFTISFSLMLLWTPSGLVFIPAFLYALLHARRLLASSTLRYTAIALLVINLPWLAMFWSSSKVATFLHAEKPQISRDAGDPAAPGEKTPTAFKSTADGINLEKSLSTLRGNAISANPLLLIFLLPGLLLLERHTKIVLALTAGWLLVMGGLLAPLKPQLELDRMLIMLALCAAIPAAVALEALFIRATHYHRIFLKLPAMLAGGFLFAGSFATAGVVSNRSIEQFYFASTNVRETSDAIRKFGGAGRVLFSGCVIHEFEHGHLAPLPFSSGKPLIASSFVHNLWKYKQIFPKSFLARGDQGIREYLDLYNVSAVMAHQAEWRNYFIERPDEYRQVWRGGQFMMFERLNAVPNYFQSGAGELLEQTTNAVKLRLTSPEAVIKFNYFPFLAARVLGAPTPSECSLYPATIAPEAELVGIRGCPAGAEIEIRSVSPFERLFAKGAPPPAGGD